MHCIINTKNKRRKWQTGNADKNYEMRIFQLHTKRNTTNIVFMLKQKKRQTKNKI